MLTANINDFNRTSSTESHKVVITDSNNGHIAIGLKPGTKLAADEQARWVGNFVNGAKNEQLREISRELQKRAQSYRSNSIVSEATRDAFNRAAKLVESFCDRPIVLTKDNSTPAQSAAPKQPSFAHGQPLSVCKTCGKPIFQNNEKGSWFHDATGNMRCDGHTWDGFKNSKVAKPVLNAELKPMTVAEYNDRQKNEPQTKAQYATAVAAQLFDGNPKLAEMFDRGDVAIVVLT